MSGKPWRSKTLPRITKLLPEIKYTKSLAKYGDINPKAGDIDYLFDGYGLKIMSMFL